ncbi:hypothetical protein AC481_00735 [miscellaneous Crenarchaeota group archaeon SMTZ-80]|nr:MAG: hypothetical protein AC481_00735 [miscellaneous Crenarchaeota group archaeon SMTZ-80]
MNPKSQPGVGGHHKLINKDYHEKDFLYNRDILNKLARHRNLKTSILENNPVLLYKWRFVFLKMKIYAPEFDEELFNKIIEFGRSKDVPSLELITNHEFPVNELSEYKAKKFFDATYIIDLRKDVEEILSSCKGGRRRDIKKALSSDITVSSEVNEEIFNQWWDLYIETVERGDFVPEKKEYIWDLLISQCGHLYTAWGNRELLAGIIIIANNYPFYWLGCSSKKYPSYNASSLLHWRVIEDYKERGYEMYDLGGASLDRLHGPTRFKASFGGQFIKTVHYQIIFRPIIYQVLNWLRYINYRILKKSTF